MNRWTEAEEAERLAAEHAAETAAEEADEIQRVEDTLAEEDREHQNMAAAIEDTFGSWPVEWAS